MTAEPGRVQSELQQTFRSLRHRNFRLYFFGQMVSLCGTWMQGMALSWLVYKITKSAWLLGVCEFANLAPVLVLALAGGWVADHKDRRKVLMCAQAVAMLQALTLVVLSVTNQLEVWQIIALAAVMGVVTSFEIPSRQSLIVNMVDREDFVNAISLNSSLFNGTRIIAPAVAAAIVSASGETACFALNALSYLASLLALSQVKLAPSAVPADSEKTSIIDGIKYAWQTESVRSLLRLTAFMSFFGAQFTFLMPVIAKDVLHHGVDGFAALRSFAGIGSFVSAIILASRGSAQMLKTGVGVAGLCFAVVLAGWAFSVDFYQSLSLALLLGFCMTFQLSGTHSLLQLNVPDQLRGRLMAVWTMFIMGMSPFGSLLIGAVTNQCGPAVSLAICAAFCFISALIFVVLKR
ncbi:MAG: MFS transporter [Candidatus Obscuribacterales bacterium]